MGLNFVSCYQLTEVLFLLYRLHRTMSMVVLVAGDLAFYWLDLTLKLVFTCKGVPH